MVSPFTEESFEQTQRSSEQKRLILFRPHVFVWLSRMAGETVGARHSNHEPRARGLKNAATMELRGFWRHLVSSFLSSQRGSHRLPKQPSGRTLSPQGFSVLRSAKPFAGLVERGAARGVRPKSVLGGSNDVHQNLVNICEPMGISHSSVGKPFAMYMPFATGVS